MYLGSNKAQINLIKDIFEKITLFKEKVSYEFTPAMKFLSEAVKETNGSKITKNRLLTGNILEHGESFKNSAQFEYLEKYRPILLEDRNVNITSQFVRIFKVFEDFRFIQQLREEMDKVRPAVVIAS